MIMMNVSSIQHSMKVLPLRIDVKHEKDDDDDERFFGTKEKEGTHS